jgi:hypothetical protein
MCGGHRPTIKTKSCDKRLESSVRTIGFVSRTAGEQNPVELNHGLTLTQNPNYCNDPTIFQKRPITITKNPIFEISFPVLPHTLANSVCPVVWTINASKWCRPPTSFSFSPQHPVQSNTDQSTGCEMVRTATPATHPTKTSLLLTSHRLHLLSPPPIDTHLPSTT